jgi:hypothetical protein
MSEDVIEAAAIVARMEHERNPADPLPMWLARVSPRAGLDER